MDIYNNMNEYMRCTNCGQELDPRYKVCPKCGTPIHQEPRPAAQPIAQNTAGDFTTQSLLASERVIANAEWHWITYMGSILLALISLIVLILTVNNGLGAGIGLGMILLSIIAFIITYWTNKTNEFTITNVRVIVKTGILMRVSFELQNENVESITVIQPLMGRLFGYGHILVCGVGASKKFTFFIKDPYQFRQYFFDQKYQG